MLLRMLKTTRAVAASIARLVVYVKLLALLTGGAKVDTNRKHSHSTWSSPTHLSTVSLTTSPLTTGPLTTGLY
jgi:hypothetical protein